MQFKVNSWLGEILGDCENSYYKPKWMERQSQNLKCVMWYEEIEVIQSSAKDKEMQSSRQSTRTFCNMIFYQLNHVTQRPTQLDKDSTREFKACA